MEQLERIVVATDFSPMSKGAFRAALTLARLSGARLHLLHVIPEYEVHSAFHINLPDRDEVEELGRRWSDKAFQGFLQGEALGEIAWTAAVRYGKPARVICAYAEELAANLIVIASHGRSGFERAVFGSVAEKVLRTATGAVLVVKS